MRNELQDAPAGQILLRTARAEAERKAITADVIMTRDSPLLGAFDGGGSEMNVRLPEPERGRIKYVGNFGTTQNINVQDANGAAIASVTPGQILLFIYTGYEWLYHGSGTGSAFEELITLVDGANVTLDASLGRSFKLVATTDTTILAPTNSPDTGNTQKIVIMYEASGGTRTLTLQTAVAGGFRFGTDLTGLTATVSGTVDYIGCIWNEADDRWDVVSYSKGY